MKNTLKQLKIRKYVVRPILSSLSTGSVHVYFNQEGEDIIFTGKENFDHFLDSMIENENFNTRISKDRQLICQHVDESDITEEGGELIEEIQEEEGEVIVSDSMIALIQEEENIAS